MYIEEVRLGCFLEKKFNLNIFLGDINVMFDVMEEFEVRVFFDVDW